MYKHDKQNEDTPVDIDKENDEENDMEYPDEVETDNINDTFVNPSQLEQEEETTTDIVDNKISRFKCNLCDEKEERCIVNLHYFFNDMVVLPELT